VIEEIRKLILTSMGEDAASKEKLRRRREPAIAAGKQ
jgi:hypothetical protein